VIGRLEAEAFSVLSLPTVGAHTILDDNRPSLSVIVASYNRSAGLMDLLGLLEKQSDVKGGFEVIVVDDESTERVADVLRAHSFAFPLRVLRRPNGGPGVARDTGIAVANGNVIVILDDDMSIPNDFLAAHQQKHHEGADVVLGHIRSPQHGLLPLFERFHQATLDKFVAAHQGGANNVEGQRLCTGNVSFSAEAYRAVGGFDLSLRRCEDRDLGIRFERAEYKIAFGENAWSEHHSDHEDVATWRKRNALYGELDQRIAEKHPRITKVSPWSFLQVLPKIAVGPALVSALLPGLGRTLASAAYRLGSVADGKKQSSLGLKLAGLCYGLDYYSGVGSQLGAPKNPLAVTKSFAAYRKQARI
jgi:GT2 family glycosyltransferase